jgi:hypothetical protein
MFGGRKVFVLQRLNFDVLSLKIRRHEVSDMLHTCQSVAVHGQWTSESSLLSYGLARLLVNGALVGAYFYMQRRGSMT